MAHHLVIHSTFAHGAVDAHGAIRAVIRVDQFTVSIPVATVTRTATSATLGRFTLIGIYVGIIPVVFGMFWLPALSRLGSRPMLFLTAATVGLLIYLGIEATSEALELGQQLGDTFQRTGLVAIGITATWLLLQAVSTRQRMATRSAAGSGSPSPW